MRAPRRRRPPLRHAWACQPFTPPRASRAPLRNKTPGSPGLPLRAPPKATRCVRRLFHYIQGVKAEIDTNAVSSMNNLDLSRSQLRESRIKLHGPEAFEGMRKAGQLAAQA